MQEKRQYTIGLARLDRAYAEGFDRQGNEMITISEPRGSRHILVLNRFRSYEKETRWGRFRCMAELAPDSTVTILALASDAQAHKAEQLNRFFQDHQVPWEEKRVYFESGGLLFANHENVLLYTLRGEYLWIAIEVNGTGTSRLHNMKLDSQGDNFMQTFPEIYQEEGSFFHRYMSIFSSIYQDLSDELESMGQYLEIDATPFPVLAQLAGWLGFEAEGNFLEENLLRRLVKELYHLNRIKGTKEVLKQIIRIMLGEEAIVIERSQMQGCIPDASRDTYRRLYGDTMQDVVILVKRQEDEKLQAQILFLLKKFKPVRSRIRLIFSGKCSILDSYCYLDYNAILAKKTGGRTDRSSKMNGTVFMQ